MIPISPPSRRRSLVPVLCLAGGIPTLLVACGGPPPPKEPVVVASASAAPLPVAKAPAPDLSPVPVPANLLLRGTWRSPAATQRALETIVGRSLEPFVQEAIGDPEVAELLERAAPIHVAVITDGGVEGRTRRRGAGHRGLDQDGVAAAFSLPLRDFAAARAFAERNATLEALGPGVVRVRRGEHGDEDLACALSLAAGAAPARMVCAEGSDVLDSVLPWMTRTLPVSADASAIADDDLTFVGDGAVLNAFLRPRLDPVVRRMTEEDPGGAGARLGDALTRLLKDTKQGEFHAKIDPNGGRVSLSLEVSGKSSPLTQLLFSGKPTGAPSELRRAPADVTNLGFSSGADADVGRSLFGDVMLHDLARHASHGHGGSYGYGSEADIRRLVNALPAFTPFWFMRGSAPRESVPRNEKWMARRMREERALLGWFGAGVSMPPADLVKYFTDLLAAVNAKQRASGGKQAKAVGRVGAAPRGFPAGSKAIFLTSEHTDWSVSSRGGRPPPVQSQTIAVVFSPFPGGADKTLVMMGVDTKDLAERAQVLLRDPPADEALRARSARIEADFEGAVAGMSVIPAVVGDAVAGSVGVTNPLRGTPNGGKTPVSLAVRPTKGGAELTAEIRVHEPSIADAGAAARLGLDLLSMSGVLRRDRGLP